MSVDKFELLVVQRKYTCTLSQTFFGTHNQITATLGANTAPAELHARAHTHVGGAQQQQAANH